MKRLLGFVFLLGLLSAVPASAQTATPTSQFVIDQAAATLAVAQGLQYRIYIDGSTTGATVPMTCTGAASPYVCTTPVGAFTPGSHTVTVTASNAAGETPKSAPLTFTMVLIPTTPQNLRVQ